MSAEQIWTQDCLTQEPILLVTPSAHVSLGLNLFLTCQVKSQTLYTEFSLPLHISAWGSEAGLFLFAFIAQDLELCDCWQNTWSYWASEYLAGYWRFKWDNFKKTFWKLQANTYTAVTVSLLIKTFSLFREEIWLFPFPYSTHFFWWLPLQDNPPSHVTLRVGGHLSDLSDTPPAALPPPPPWHLHWEISWSGALLATAHHDQVWFDSIRNEFHAILQTRLWVLASAHALLPLVV